MKKIIAVITCLTCLNCYGQVLVEQTSLGLEALKKALNDTSPQLEQPVGFENFYEILMWPYQKIHFDIVENLPSNRILIIDTNGRVLYSQTKGLGHFDYAVADHPKAIIIYDLINEKNCAIAMQGKFDDFHAVVYWGSDAISANITADALPIPVNSSTYHFVRFLKLGPIPIDDIHFSVSLSKIPPLSIRTEPEIDKLNGEDNVITDAATSLLSGKRFFIKNKG